MRTLVFVLFQFQFLVANIYLDDKMQANYPTNLVHTTFPFRRIYH